MTYVKIERQSRVGPRWEKRRVPDASAKNRLRAQLTRSQMADRQSADFTEFEEFWESLDPRLAELFLLYTIPLIIGVTLPTKL